MDSVTLSMLISVPAEKGIYYGHDAADLQRQSEDVVPVYLLPQDEIRQQRDEYRVPGKEHRHHAGLAVHDGQLIQHHAHRDAQKAGQRQPGAVFAVQAHVLLPQYPHGEWHKAQPADEEPLHSYLHGLENAAHRRHLQHDLHRAEDQRAQHNINVSRRSIFFHLHPPLQTHKTFEL
jgi:hypothetical protein